MKTKKIFLSKNIDTIENITDWSEPFDSYEITFRCGLVDVFYIDQEMDVIDNNGYLLNKGFEQELEIIKLITNMALGEYENQSKILSVL